MNHVDAEIISYTLSERNYKPAKDCAKANLIVVVTCGVRNSAEERIVSWTQKLKTQSKNSVIVLTGCLSHREDIKTRLHETVDLFIPIENWMARKDEIFSLTHNVGAGLKPAPTGEKNCFYQILPQRASTFQAYIPIMTGCNNFCSYCVVPYARGREKSRSPESIINEAEQLVKKGCKELYLLGQNVNSYQGKDKNNRIWNFARLLKNINGIAGNFWIRFISSHPKDITEKFIETYANCRKVSSNLHLPIQSGSNKILGLMNRKYTRENYLDIISKIRRRYPQAVLSTDIIVGFPGETDKDFRDSLDIVKKVGFEMLFSLKYSSRPETAAQKMKDSVPPAIKIARQRKLDQVWKKIALAKNKRFLGQEIKILVDRIKTKTDNHGKITRYVQGKSFENKDIQGLIKSGKGNDLIGKWATVKISETTAVALRGELARVKKNI